MLPESPVRHWSRNRALTSEKTALSSLPTGEAVGMGWGGHSRNPVCMYIYRIQEYTKLYYIVSVSIQEYTRFSPNIQSFI